LQRRQGSIRIRERIPSTIYTFAGEVPWADTYPWVNPDIYSFPVGTKSVERVVTKSLLYQNGQLVEEEDANALLHTFFAQAFRERLGARESDDALDANVAELAKFHGYEIKTIEVVEAEEQAIYEELEGLVAVTRHGWENYHSTVNPSFLVYTPTKDITQRLGLAGKPQTFDLFEQNGRLASVSFQPAQGSNRFPQTMTYLRRDLMERYLEETHSELLWLTWGERQVLSPDHKRLSSKLYRAFQSVHAFDS
jgi:hypothetical protein